MKTPVLFITFARPEYASRIFNQLRTLKVSSLYLYSNKARADRPDEIKRNEEIRSWVNEIDWECDVHTFFRDEYVDVYTSVQGAIDWVFDNEEQAIILEEDCLPTCAFFEYIDRYINQYKNDESVMLLSGDNYANAIDYKGADHIKCSTFYMYGWASWSKKWKSLNMAYDVDTFLNSDALETYYPSKRKQRFWRSEYQRLNEFLTRTHCWDYMLGLNCILNKMYVIVPTENLIQNIGLYGAHSNGSEDNGKRKCIPLDFHYTFTGILSDKEVSVAYDDYVFELSFGKQLSLKHKISCYIKSIVRAIVGNRVYETLKKTLKSK